jgi:DNA-binding MarR family transcriptional regulator
MSFYQQAGNLILGTRLRSLGDRFLSMVQDLYYQLDIPFEASWFPLFYLLDRHERLSMMDASRELGFSHSAISQMAASLRKKGLLTLVRDAEDARRRDLTLTEEGRALLARIKPVWLALDEVLRQEQKAGQDWTPALENLDRLLQQPNIPQRILYLARTTEIRLAKAQLSSLQNLGIPMPQNGAGKELTVALSNEEILGGIQWNRGEQAELTWIWVHPAYRRRGIATRLLRETQDELPEGLLVRSSQPDILSWLARTVPAFTVLTK